MTVLVSDLVAETRQYFLGNIREQRNKVVAGGTTASTSDTTITFAYDLGPIKQGAVLTVGLERMLVWSTTDSSKQAVVERAYDGTTIATHTAGDLVTVNGRCDDFTIVRAFNNELNALSSPARGLFREREGDFLYNPSTYGYDLTSPTFGTIIGQPLDVRAEQTGTGEWISLPQSAWEFNAKADTDDFPSGRSLTLFGTGGSSGLKIRVVYRAPFVNIAALDDDVQTDLFFPATANDLLPMGAALQLGSARPMQRADLNAQGSSRRAEETSTQDTLIAVAGLRARYEQRVLDEATRLASLYPQAI